MRYLIAGDIHGGWADPKALDTINGYLQRNPVDKIVQVGDWFDPTSISRHETGRLRFLKGRTLEDEANIVVSQQRSMWDANGKRGRIDWLMGNHELWLEQWLDRHPEVGEIISFDALFSENAKVVERKPSYPDKTVDYGLFHVTHGCYTGGNSLQRHLYGFGKPVFFGHTHAMGQYSHRWQATGAQTVAYNVGFLARYDLHYLKAPPSTWQQGFALVETAPREKLFTARLVPFVDHRFVLDGRVYGPRGSKPI